MGEYYFEFEFEVKKQTPGSLLVVVLKGHPPAFFQNHRQA